MFNAKIIKIFNLYITFKSYDLIFDNIEISSYWFNAPAQRLHYVHPSQDWLLTKSDGKVKYVHYRHWKKANVYDK